MKTKNIKIRNKMRREAKRALAHVEMLEKLYDKATNTKLRPK